jgi:hypothetical protein
VLGVPLFDQFTLDGFGGTARGYRLLRQELLTSDSDNVQSLCYARNVELASTRGALAKFMAPAGVSGSARRNSRGRLSPHGRPHMVQRGLHPAGQDEDKQGILEVLNLEDHVLFAPSRLRDREGIFLYLDQRVSLKLSDLSLDTTWLVIPETHILMN